MLAAEHQLPGAPFADALLRATSWNIEATKAKEIEPQEPVDNLQELLAYYKQRLEDREAANNEAVNKSLKEISVSNEELHKIKWELRVKHEEVHSLQKALSDANVQLYDERATVLKLTAETEELRVEALEDRRKIQHLLALTQPVSQEVTFFKDCRPQKMTRFPSPRPTEMNASHASGDSASDLSLSQFQSQAKRSSSQGTESTNGSMGKSKGKPVTIQTSWQQPKSPPTPGNRAPWQAPHISPQMSCSRKSTGNTAKHVIRTVYLPSEHADTLLLTVDSLKAQLQDEKALADAQAKAFAMDRNAKMAQMDRMQKEYSEQCRSLEDQLDREKAKLRDTTQDYLALRHRSLVYERESTEARSALQGAVDKLCAEKVGLIGDSTR
jgi:coiled-coil domain-containing protein 77